MNPLTKKEAIAKDLLTISKALLFLSMVVAFNTAFFGMFYNPMISLAATSYSCMCIYVLRKLL